MAQADALWLAPASPGRQNGGQKMQIGRVQDPAVVDDKRFVALVKAAVKTTVLKEEPIERLLEGLRDALSSENVGVFIGAEGPDLKAIAVVFLPMSKLSSSPQVYHFFCTGGAKMRDALVDKVLAFARKNGYNQLWAINGTGKPDAAWAYAFKRAGPPLRIGSVMEFKTK